MDLQEARQIINSVDSEMAKLFEKRMLKHKDYFSGNDIIKSNYDFTVYSDDNDNNTIIQLTDYRNGYVKPNNALIKYNKNTKEMTVVNKESPKAKYIIDESGKILHEEHEKDIITQNWEYLAPILGIVTSGALVLEKFFKYPQDIEGGITKDGKVFFWQTRDIVAKAVKRI